MRCVEAGYCKMSDLIDGTLTLEHVALMNMTLDCSDENRRRFEEANRIKK
jgi:hypothetical protein